MRVSTKGRYALRMLIDLAEHRQDGFVSLKDIAERQNLSKKYLEQIVPTINKPTILRTNRGFMGGYQLAREPAAINRSEPSPRSLFGTRPHSVRQNGHLRHLAGLARAQPRNQRLFG